MSEVADPSTVGGRDTPPHQNRIELIGNDSIFGPALTVPDSLISIDQPYVMEEGENLREGRYKVENLPGVLSPRSFTQMDAKARVVQAVGLGWNYLKRNALIYVADLPRSTTSRPRIHDILNDLDDLLTNARCLVNDAGEIQALAPTATKLKSITSKISTLIRDFQPDILHQGLAIPRTPIWATHNDADDFWTPNDYEILAASFRHETEYVLKVIGPFVPTKERKGANVSFLEPATPVRPKHKSTSVSERTHRHTRVASSSIPTAITRDLSTDRVAELIGSGESDKDGSKGSSGSDGNETPTKRSLGGREFLAPSGGGEPPSSSSDDSDSLGRNTPPPKPSKKPTPPPAPSTSPPTTTTSAPRDYHFDLKLKRDEVPTWDGNADLLARWIDKVNTLSKRSDGVHKELGSIIPTRFKGAAELWYYSIPSSIRTDLEKSWSTMRKAISNYWMSHAWLEDQKQKADKARYRQPGHERESPSEYVIRKLELLRLTSNKSDSGTIRAIMEESPDPWSSILQPQFQKTILEFQNSVKYHEESLIRAAAPLVALPVAHSSNSNRFNPSPRFFRKAAVNLVGWAKTIAPQFPKDDSTISKGKTPEMAGARPCRHCGSSKHWDNDCKHSRKGERLARTNFASITQDELDAQAAYDELYYQYDESDNDSSAQNEQDFRKPLQITSLLSSSTYPGANSDESNADLKGNSGSYESLGMSNASSTGIHLNGPLPPTTCSTLPPRHERRRAEREDRKLQSKNLAPSSKPALNRRTRRQLAKDIARVHYTVLDAKNGNKPVVELKKYLARPPGCSFLGSKATSVPITVNSIDSNHSSIIVDSGSDITLVSFRTLQELGLGGKLRIGEKINLVQVTGSTSISGYVSLDLYFHSPEGPVKINVEAYVVKGMSTPFILGNDFADQYSLSLLRLNGDTHLELGDSNRRIKVENSTSPSQLDKDGHAFKVLARPAPATRSKKASHRIHQRTKRKSRQQANNSNVRSACKIIIPPSTTVAVPVFANFPPNSDHLYVEKVFTSN